MTEPIDFTHCERVPNRAYNGANGKKIAARHESLGLGAFCGALISSHEVFQISVIQF
jgi:hypothetical protein